MFGRFGEGGLIRKVDAAHCGFIPKGRGVNIQRTHQFRGSVYPPSSKILSCISASSRVIHAGKGLSFLAETYSRAPSTGQRVILHIIGSCRKMREKAEARYRIKIVRSLGELENTARDYRHSHRKCQLPRPFRIISNNRNLRSRIAFQRLQKARLGRQATLECQKNG